MKKVYILGITIVLILWWLIIGKSIQIDKQWWEDTSIITATNDLTDWIGNYSQDFRFPWETGNNISSEMPIIKNLAIEKRLPAFAMREEYKNNILKTKSMKDGDTEYISYLVKGYSHEYRFPNFGIMIKTSDPADNENYFVKDSTAFQRYRDQTYDVVKKWYGALFYIRRFELETWAVFDKNYLEKHNFFTWTIIVTWNQESDKDQIFETWVSHFYQQTPDNSYGDGIWADEVWNMSVIYLYNSQKQPKYYYKLAYTDACASSCWIPEKVEIIAQ